MGVVRVVKPLPRVPARVVWFLDPVVRPVWRLLDRPVVPVRVVLVDDRPDLVCPDDDRDPEARGCWAE